MASKRRGSVAPASERERTSSRPVAELGGRATAVAAAVESPEQSVLRMQRAVGNRAVGAFLGMREAPPAAPSATAAPPMTTTETAAVSGVPPTGRVPALPSMPAAQAEPAAPAAIPAPVTLAVAATPVARAAERLAEPVTSAAGTAAAAAAPLLRLKGSPAPQVAPAARATSPHTARAGMILSPAAAATEAAPATKAAVTTSVTELAAEARGEAERPKAKRTGKAARPAARSEVAVATTEARRESGIAETSGEETITGVAEAPKAALEPHRGIADSESPTAGTVSPAADVTAVAVPEPGKRVAPAKEAAVVTIAAADPGGILDQLRAVPATQAVQAYNQALDASTTALASQQQKVGESLPELPAPTGLPANDRATADDKPLPESKSQVDGGFETRASGREGPEYDVTAEAPPPLPANKPTRLVGGEASESGAGDPVLSASAQAALDDVRLDTDRISTSAGERPTVDLTGAGNPGQLDSFASEAAADVQAAKIWAVHDSQRDFGENEVFPNPTDETVRSSKRLSPPRSPKGKAGPPPTVPGEATAGLDVSLSPVLRDRIAAQEAEYQAGLSQFDADAVAARQNADAETAALDADTRVKQTEEQQKALASVNRSRSQWQSELDAVENDYEKKAGEATAEQRKKVSDERSKGEEKADAHLVKAEQDAVAETRTAERKATQKKEAAEKDSGGFWGWVASKAKALIDGLKEAVNFIYDGLRKAVKLIFEAAKALALAAIELARQAIIGLITAFGTILKTIVNVVFAAFPAIAKRINAAIDTAIDAAVRAVNAAADLLKKGVAAVLDFLAETIDKLLGIIQDLYNGILEVLGMIISGEFAELMTRLGYLVDAAKKVPEKFETAALEELLGGNLDEPLSPMELAQAGLTPPNSNGQVPSQGDSSEALPSPPWTTANLGVDSVMDGMELSPDLAEELLELTGGAGEFEFGRSDDPSRSADAIMAELSGSSSGPTASSTVNAQDGLSPTQRAEVKWKLMKDGLQQWWTDNQVAIIGGAILAIVGAIALIVVTGGGILAALPPLMAVLGPIFIGATIAVIAGHVRDYFSKAWDGDTDGGGKSLAKGLAAGAVELISLVTFKAGGALLKGAKSAAKASLKLAKSTAKVVASGSRYIIRRGRVLLRGIAGSALGKRARSVVELGKSLLERLRFRAFRFRITGRSFVLEGLINPWIRIASGKVTVVDAKVKGAVKVTDDQLSAIKSVGTAKKGRLYVSDSNWKELIKNPPPGMTADDVRYMRHQYKSGNPLPRNKWQEKADRLAANRGRGRADERKTLEAAGIDNNNIATETSGVIQFEVDDVVTRPDGITSTKVVDVKSIEEGTHYYTQQLQTQKKGAVKGLVDGQKRDLAVVLTGGAAGKVRPSGPLADNALVLHRNAKTNQWSRWNVRANNGSGGWTEVTADTAKKWLHSK